MIEHGTIQETSVSQGKDGKLRAVTIWSLCDTVPAPCDQAWYLGGPITAEGLLPQTGDNANSVSGAFAVHPAGDRFVITPLDAALGMSVIDPDGTSHPIVDGKVLPTPGKVIVSAGDPTGNVGDFALFLVDPARRTRAPVPAPAEAKGWAAATISPDGSIWAVTAGHTLWHSPDGHSWTKNVLKKGSARLRG